MNVKVTVAVLAALAIPSVNANGLLADAPEDGSVGNLDFGYVSTSGNSDSTSLNGAFDYITRISSPWAMGFSLTGINNANSDVRSAEKYTFAWNNRYDLDSTSFLYGTVDYTNDYFGAYDYQAGAYVGYGKQILQDDNHNFSLGLAVGYRINAAFVGEDEKEGVLRGDLAYSYKISDSAQFDQKLTAIWGEEVDTYNSETAISTKISESLALKVAYLVAHNSVVPVGRDKTDTTLSVGVSYSF